MSTATAGRAREHRVRDALMAEGWELIARSAGSRGPADLIMASETRGVALIQVGTTSKRLSPADRTRLLHAAALCNATPVLAVAGRGGISWWRVDAGTAGTWAGWSPDG